jgi:hypothetical protein
LGCIKLFPDDTLPESERGLEPARNSRRNQTKDDQRHKICPAVSYIVEGNGAVVMDRGAAMPAVISVFGVGPDALPMAVMEVTQI